MVIEKKRKIATRKKGLKPNSMGIIEGMKGFTTFVVSVVPVLVFAITFTDHPGDRSEYELIQYQISLRI